VSQLETNVDKSGFRLTNYPERLLLCLGIVLVLLIAFSLFVGRYPGLSNLTLGTFSNDDLFKRLVINLRLPRLLTAALLGMCLAAAGEVFQMIFANPLVEPGFLGVSQGAAFGAALCIIFLSSTALMVQTSAAIFAFLGLLFSYLFAHRIRYGGWVLRLVLAGIAVSALFSSAVGILKYLADPLRQLPEITYWLLGGLWGITWSQFLSILPVVTIGLVILFSMRWRLNLLSLEDQTSFSLGASPSLERSIMLIGSVAITAAVVSVGGIVGWVGLLVPHLARRIFGSDTRYALPGSMLLGGVFTVLCDDLARTLLAGEIPLGIFTSLLGALGFIIIMSSKRLSFQK